MKHFAMKTFEGGMSRIKPKWVKGPIMSRVFSFLVVLVVGTLLVPAHYAKLYRALMEDIERSGGGEDERETRYF